MKIIIGAIALALLVINAGVFLIARTRGGKDYEEYIEPLDPKEFKTKSMLGAGLFLQERVNLTRKLPGILQEPLRRYSNRVGAQIAELYGARDRDYYLCIHSANNWVISLLAGIFLPLFALICCANGDTNTALVFCVAVPFGMLGLPLLLDKELETKVEKRRESIQLEFPEFVNKLILLVNAGSTITKAWDKIVADSKTDSPLFRELRVCMAEIQSGKPESVAYEEFARRCKIKEVIKFVSVIVLNLRKGGSEVVITLKAQADECWEARKATARRLGEKASSKLLFPMAVMLLGIIMIVALPAILALAGSM